MTEAEWLTCDRAWQMLHYVQGKVSDRKLRLFSVACCRRIWHLLVDERSRQAVEAAEQYADRMISWEDLKNARRKAAERVPEAAWDRDIAWEWNPTGRIDWEAIQRADRRLKAAEAAVCATQRSPWEGTLKAFDAVWGGGWELKYLRDIVNNPFRPTRADLTWLDWNDQTVPKIAQRIYDERDFTLLPILADALEDAGCGNEDILRHCREPGEHVRGCWVVDLLLGKE